MTDNHRPRSAVRDYLARTDLDDERALPWLAAVETVLDVVRIHTHHDPHLTAALDEIASEYAGLVEIAQRLCHHFEEGPA